MGDKDTTSGDYALAALMLLAVVSLFILVGGCSTLVGLGLRFGFDVVFLGVGAVFLLLGLWCVTGMRSIHRQFQEARKREEALVREQTSKEVN